MWMVRKIYGYQVGSVSDSKGVVFYVEPAGKAISRTSSRHVNRCHAGNTCVAEARCKPGTLYWGHTCCKIPFRSMNLFMGLTNLKKKNGFPRNWINPPGSSVERPRGRSSGADVFAVLGVQANPPALYSIAWFSKSVWQTKFTKGQEHCCAVAQCEAHQVVLNIAVLMPTLCAPVSLQVKRWHGCGR